MGVRDLSTLGKTLSGRRRAPAALREPRDQADPHPDRRQNHVEDEETEGEEYAPEGPVEPWNGSLHACWRRDGSPAHAGAAMARSCTIRMIRCAVSSIARFETSMMGQPSRLWISPAYSSSS